MRNKICGDTGGSSMSRRSLALITAVALMAGAVGTAHLAAQGQRWGKAAPFPEPEEELYAVTVNNKMYVIGGFGYMPFGNPPGLVYEYDAASDKWTKKKILPQRVHHQAQAATCRSATRPVSSTNTTPRR